MKTWRTIYWRNKKLAQLKRWPALLGDPFLWFAPNRSRTNFSSNTNTFGLPRRVNPVKARKPEHAQVPLLSALRSGKEQQFVKFRIPQGKSISYFTHHSLTITFIGIYRNHSWKAICTKWTVWFQCIPGYYIWFTWFLFILNTRLSRQPYARFFLNMKLWANLSARIFVYLHLQQ